MERLFWNFSPEKSGRKLITSYRRKEDPALEPPLIKGLKRLLFLWRHREKEQKVGVVEKKEHNVGVVEREEKKTISAGDPGTSPG